MSTDFDLSFVRDEFYGVDLQRSTDGDIDVTGPENITGKMSRSLEKGHKIRITFWQSSTQVGQPLGKAKAIAIKEIIDKFADKGDFSFGIEATCVGTGKP